MSSAEHLSLFIASAALLLILPGPTNALLMTVGATSKWRGAGSLLAAELAAYALAITPLLIFNEALGGWRTVGGLVLKTIAILLVLVIAFRLWRSKSAPGDTARLVTRRDIFFITLFNPKALIFAFAIFPPVNGWSDLTAKALLFTGLAIVCGTAWIALGSLMSVSRFRAEWAGKVAALVLCGFALYLGATIVAQGA